MHGQRAADMWKTLHRREVRSYVYQCLSERKEMVNRKKDFH